MYQNNKFYKHFKINGVKYYIAYNYCIIVWQ